jgi:two-component system, OmpR family, sensor kinase
MTTTTTMTTTTAMMTTTSTWGNSMTRPRRFRLGFRGRVLGFSTALLLVATSVGLVVQRAVLLQRLDNEVAASLEQERVEIERLAAGRDPATGQPFADDVRAIFDTFLRRNVPGEGEAYLTFVDGAVYLGTPAPGGVRLDRDPRLAQRWASLGTGEAGSLNTEAGPVDYLAVPLRSQNRTLGVFVVANFLRGEREEIEDSIRVEAAVSAGVLIVTVGAAWVIAGRLLRPVRQLTDTARTITDTDLSRRIPVEGDDEIAELTRTFNEMLDRLTAAFAVQRAFVDDAGHELRTPITIVRGHLELMGDEPHDREETVALVTDELDRMSRIVDDLLLLAKAEQPDFVQLQPVEASDLTTELLVKARALGPRDWRLDTCASGTFLADPQRLTQAVLNLARNAVEHTTPGAEVALGSIRRDGEVRIWVRDTGPGVDPAERDRIFERFARGRGGPRRSEGAGLGLAIVRAIAAGHHGRVELDSRPGAGATFTLVLPDSSEPGSDDAALDTTSDHTISLDPPARELPAVADDDATAVVDVVREVQTLPDQHRPPDPGRGVAPSDETQRTSSWPGS